MYMVSYGDPNQLLHIACVEGYLAVKYKAVWPQSIDQL